jgi:hypothetical protein
MRNKKLRQPGEAWSTPTWSAINSTDWLIDRDPSSFKYPGRDKQLFSSRYNAFYTQDQVVCTYRRVFIGGGDNVQGGGVYTRTQWNSKAVNDALAGLRGVVSASLYDGMRLGNKSPAQTALGIASEVASCWQPDQASHLMSIIEREMCDRGMM